MFKCNKYTDAFFTVIAGMIPETGDHIDDVLSDKYQTIWLSIDSYSEAMSVARQLVSTEYYNFSIVVIETAFCGEDGEVDENTRDSDLIATFSTIEFDEEVAIA